MSMDSGDFTSRVPAGAPPLPPAFELDQLTGKFTGTAEPGLSVKIASSIDKRIFAAAVDAEGHWSIDIGDVPRWYAVYRVWTTDTDSDLSSEKMEFVVGGKRPKLTDLYASETAIFGFSTQGSNIVILGPSGRPLVDIRVAREDGFWFKRLKRTLRPGDRICVVASRPEGGVSLPLHATVQKFSIGESNVARVTGTGARAGDCVELWDEATGLKVHEAVAADSGAWSMSFDKQMQDGQRLYVRRLHPDGTTSAGPLILAGTNTCVWPVIDGIADGQAWGYAPPGYKVQFSLYSPSSLPGPSPVYADPNGVWRATGVNAGPGYLLMATCSSPDNTTKSSYYNAMTYMPQAYTYYGSRQNPPFYNTASNSTVTGWGNPGDYVVVASNSDGQAGSTVVGTDGTWTVNISDYDPDETYFLQMMDTTSTVLPGNTSISIGRQLAYQAPPLPPVMTTYDGTTFAGTEQTPQTVVKVFDINMGLATVAKQPFPVQGGQWSGTADITDNSPPVPLGDEVYAMAYYLESYGLGQSSDPSATHTVGPSTQTAVKPVPPEIDQPGQDGWLSGTTLVNTKVTVTRNGTALPPVASTDENWTIHIGTIGAYDEFSAVAAYSSSTGGQPLESDPYIRKMSNTQIGPLHMTSVSATSAGGTAPQGGQQILGWRLSDGTKVFDYQLASDATTFNAYYIGDITLDDNDLVYFVSAFPSGGTMTPYDTKQVGFSE